MTRGQTRIAANTRARFMSSCRRVWDCPQGRSLQLVARRRRDSGSRGTSDPSGLVTRIGPYTQQVLGFPKSVRTGFPTDLFRAFIVIGALVLVVVHGLWPKTFEVDSTTLALVVVIVVVALLPLLESASFPGGGGVVLRKQLDKLNEAAVSLSAEEVAKADTSGPDEETPASAALLDAQRLATDAVVSEVLEEARRSPRLALMLLSAELERAIHHLLMGTGLGETKRRWSIRLGVARLVEVGVIPASAESAVDLFLKVRNAVVHGAATANENDILRAIDSGIEIYSAVAQVPRERNFVLFADIPLFGDEGATAPVPEGAGVMLRTVSPDAERTERERIFPTTRDHFRPGEEVAWVWGSEHMWGPTWYRDPRTNAVHKGWDSSAEFIGPPI